MIDTQFLPTFLEEAHDTLEQWESACLSLEQSPSAEILNSLFRSAHNIKGSSRSVGLLAFSQLVHRAEDVISLLKSGDIAVSSSIVEALLNCHRCLVEWTEKLNDNPAYEADTSLLIQSLEKFIPNTTPKEDSSDPGFGFFDDEPAATSTPAANAKSAQKDIGTILIESGQATAEQVESALKQQTRRLGEILVEQGVVSNEAVKAALELQKNSGQRPDETIRVSLRKLDALIRLVGELSIQHSIVKNALDTGNLNEASAQQAIGLTHKVIQDLQSETMSLRMQPLQGLFQRLERVARDVARQVNKQITVVQKGIEVELDKTVIEQMKDPLVHILRNAVDHGVESTELRAISRKPELATITIEGIQTASNVAIEISDDGQGLNEEKILRKAKERGLVPQDANPPSEEIHQMIFLPGFSTADKVTNVSGRGVGMDVVKRAVDELGGTIRIESKRGSGTRFIVNLPSTLSILDAVIVDLNNQLYSVPVQDVDEVVDLSSLHIDTTTQKGKLLNLRGRILPVEKLSAYLTTTNIKTQDHSHRSATGVALIAKHHATTVAFEVDRVVGQQSIVVRQLDGKLANVRGLAGGTILANGEPSMIVHLPELVKTYISLAKSS